MRPTDALLHPEDWATTTVGRSVEVKRGVSWSKAQEHAEARDDRVPVIRIGNVQRTLELDDLLYVSGLTTAEIEDKRVTAGWTVMVGSYGNRARIGNAVLIRNDAEFLFASFLIGARPNADSGLTPDYLYRWLSTEQVQAYLSASSEGTTGLSNLSHSFFKAMAIPVPPPAGQAGIARILDAVDEAMERTRAAIHGAQVMRQALIHELLARGLRSERQQNCPAGLIPASWACEPLGNHILEGPTNGVYRPEGDYAGHGTRILRIDDFADGQVHSLPALRRVVVEPVVQRRFALREDDVVINRVNSLSHIGKAALVPALEEHTMFESNIVRLRCGPRLLPGFVVAVLCSDIARRHWLARAKPAVNQASVNQRDVRELAVPLPDVDEQLEVIQILSGARNKIAMLHHVAATQQQLKRSLMHDLLTGRVLATTLANAATS